MTQRRFNSIALTVGLFCCILTIKGALAESKIIPPTLPSQLIAIRGVSTEKNITVVKTSVDSIDTHVYHDIISPPSADVIESSRSNTIANTIKNYAYLNLGGEQSGSVTTSELARSTALPLRTIFFASDFENDNLSGWIKELVSTPYAAQIVNNPIRSGSKSLRIELRQSDPDVAGSRRAELAHRGMNQNGEYWFAFSILLPNDYALDRSQEILAQWHNWPDKNLGEDWMSPPLALLTSNGRWRINRLWDDANVSSNTSVVAKGYTRQHDLGTYEADKGRWTDWVFHIKWGWQASQDPKLEIYKNGTLVLNQNGQPNTTNDVTPPYFKIGVYKWDWKSSPQQSDTTTRVVYYDRILIGNNNSALRDMQ